MEYESDGDTNYNWCTWNNLQRIGKGTRWLKKKSIHTTALLTSARLETWCHSNSSEKPSANVCVKKLSKEYDYINSWILTFRKSISVLGNAENLVQNLNLNYRVNFLR